MTTRSALSMAVVVLLCASPMTAQTDTERASQERGQSSQELPVSLDRIKRSLNRPPSADGESRLLELTEFVVVVGTAPELPLFEEGDFDGGPWSSAHAEMTAAVRPARLDQAVGSDALGVASAALFALIPPAIRAVGGWFSGDADVVGPGWAGYTDTFVLGTEEPTPPHEQTLVFHRLAGQRVVFHATVSDPEAPGVLVRVDGRKWRTVHEDVAEQTMPDDLLSTEQSGDMHSLTISRFD